MKLINYINHWESISAQSDERSDYLYSIRIVPEMVANERVGYGEPTLVWTGKYIASLGDLKAVDFSPVAAVEILTEEIENLPDIPLKDWEHRYRT